MRKHSDRTRQLSLRLLWLWVLYGLVTWALTCTVIWLLIDCLLAGT